MPEIAVIGDRDSVWPFAAFGFQVRPVTDADESRRVFSQCLSQDYAILFVTEDVLHDCVELADALKEQPLPAVIPLPDLKKGSQGLGTEQIRKAMRTAIGKEIM